ncbi:siderophore-interacting protein [Tomitella biformata]|uniref:siderophore-interacting protein n=1 Tax=Tomitella biformata TaxID=630403 RepID=UPI000462FACF|nr:siderophore-interacting protein [Tomitella biformata]
MARTNLKARAIKPAMVELLMLRVLRREQISPNVGRITLGHGDIGRFAPMGFDQWFRLFLPVKGGNLDRAPKKLDTVSYLRFMTISESERPVIRNYTVRAYRPTGDDGPELDIDVILHGSAADGTAGPASGWAQTCQPGDAVAILDEGIGFAPPEDAEQLLLVADETGLPAVAGILAALPRDARGQAIVEIPDHADRQELNGPDGVEVTWLARTDPAQSPGLLALAEVEGRELPTEPTYGWVVGEQALAAGVRRHWVAAGLPKDRVMFCGYWKHAHG